MIHKTTREFKRIAPSWDDGKGDTHCERIRRETWWLFGFIPLYMRDSLLVSNI